MLASSYPEVASMMGVSRLSPMRCMGCLSHMVLSWSMMFIVASSWLAHPSSTHVVTTTAVTSPLTLTLYFRTASITSLMASVAASSPRPNESIFRNMLVRSSTKPWGLTHVCGLLSLVNLSTLSATFFPSITTTPLKNSTTLTLSSSLSSAVMPTSSSTIRGSCGLSSPLRTMCQSRDGMLAGDSSRTSTLPGWRSAWMKLSFIIILSSVMQPSRATLGLKWWSPCRYSVICVPSSQLSTSTRSATNGATGMGKVTLFMVAKFSWKRKRLSASMERSSCSKSGVANGLMLSSRRIQRRKGTALHTWATVRMSAKSLAMIFPTPGWRTLTATTVPSGSPAWRAPSALSAALWICAMLPLATGASSIQVKMSLILHLKDPSTERRVNSQSCAGASQWSLESSLVMSRGKRSLRDAAHCPHLMKAGPAISRVHRNSLSHSLRCTPYMSATGAVTIIGRSSSARLIARATAIAPSPTTWTPYHSALAGRSRAARALLRRLFLSPSAE
mmetsp:Transcript_48047/g.153991  ORF Transcript_48047/g.153991 Transcript_48047/m.153991 type:complete len:503 (-) Transcript_48047:650-2158(-)